MKLGLNCSGIRVLNGNSTPTTQGKLCTVWGKGYMGTIICGWDLLTIEIPLPNLLPRYGDNMLRVYGREANMPHNILLLYGTKTSPCLSVPQTYCTTRP
jgi:hypothetical protein